MTRAAVVSLSMVLALAMSSGAAGGFDYGRPYNKVPARFSSTVNLGYGSARAIWRQEWIVCGGDTMLGLARDPEIRLGKTRLLNWLSASPQYASSRLADFIETGD